MDQHLSKLIKLITPNNSPTKSNQSAASQPQIGFKLTFCDNTKQLIVKVIGARSLPQTYGSTKPIGYLVKVTAFPCREKHETAIIADSWPTFNEEFAFSINSPSSPQKDHFDGKFISFTVYAVLQSIKEQQHNSKEEKQAPLLKRFLSFTEKNEDNARKFRGSFRHSLNSRRTVGNVTYNLDKKAFEQTVRGIGVATPDIWRDIKIITSGAQTSSREGKNGAVEVTLSYSLSEDSQNDVVEVSVTKFRCSLQTMQEHEKMHGHLYIKLTAFEQDDLIQKMKSDNFDATISLKIQHSTFRVKVTTSTLDQVKILIRLINKNMLGQKTLLGKIEIDRNSELWKEIVATPSKPITKMIYFE